MDSKQTEGELVFNKLLDLRLKLRELERLMSEMAGGSNLNIAIEVNKPAAHAIANAMFSVSSGNDPRRIVDQIEKGELKLLGGYVRFSVEQKRAYHERSAQYYDIMRQMQQYSLSNSKYADMLRDAMRLMPTDKPGWAGPAPSFPMTNNTKPVITGSGTNGGDITWKKE